MIDIPCSVLREEDRRENARCGESGNDSQERGTLSGVLKTEKEKAR